MIIIYIYEFRKIPTIYVGLLYLIMRNKMGWGVKRKRYEGRKKNNSNDYGNVYRNQ